MWLSAAALFVLHQDFWWWDNRTLVFGFLPVSLLYHAVFSIVAGLIWALASKYAWPADIEAWASETDDASRTGGKP